MDFPDVIFINQLDFSFAAWYNDINGIREKENGNG